jgi:hypothetical protein
MHDKLTSAAQKDRGLTDRPLIGAIAEESVLIPSGFMGL